jgi:hypothetical protein
MGVNGEVRNLAIGETWGPFEPSRIRQLVNQYIVTAPEAPPDRRSEMIAAMQEVIGLPRGTMLATSRPAHKGYSDPPPIFPSGILSSLFESTGSPAAVGYDHRGGTSYGKYQISSKAGTMDVFIRYLRTEEPEWAERLAAAGPANTGGKQGRMPRVWRLIAVEEPVRFEALQHDFVKRSHFDPATRAILQKANIEVATLSPTVQEVLWSTAIQHGPAGAAEIFCTAHDCLGPAPTADTEDDLIRAIYKERAKYFALASNEVRSAVKSRLARELAHALQLLKAADPGA